MVKGRGSREVWTVILCIGYMCMTYAQQDTIVATQLEHQVQDTTKRFGNDAGRPSPEKMDSIVGKSFSPDTNIDLDQLSKSSRSNPSQNSDNEGGVIYGAQDSSITDLTLQVIHLYGQAYVRYDDMEVLSDYILMDLRTNEVKATSRSKKSERPVFNSGNQVVAADEIRFNLDTQEGIVRGARIQQDQYYIHGAVTKFVRAENDSLHIDDVIYNRNAVLTTCGHDHPHWGIRTSKLKIIPEKLAVVGPFDMELGGVPTPLALPFAFAPLFSIGQSTSGILFPERDPLVIDADLGIGTRGIGYYFALSDKLDLKLTADVYTRGSFTLNGASNYYKRYKYRGNVGMSYSRQITDSQTDANPQIATSYRFNISHQQDSKAHPFRTVGGTINFTLNDFDRRNFTDVNSQLNSQINSNFSYNYKINSKARFSAGLRHSQNTLDRRIDFTLPDLQLRVSQFFPFKRKGSSAGKERWYEKINMQYDGRIQGRVSTTDTLLFTQETLDLFRYGASQDVSANASYKLLQHFNFNTGVNYEEFNYFQTFDVTGIDENGNQEGGISRGLETLRELSVTAGVSTNIFGTVLFRKGKLRGLRHQMTPTLGLSFSPGTENLIRTIDFEALGVDPDSIDLAQQTFNPFRAQGTESLIFNNRLVQGGASVTFGIANTLEGKIWSKRDSAERKVNLLRAFNINGSYNLQADSLNWSLITLSANTQLFGGLTRVTFNGSIDPYIEVNNRRINTTTLSAEGKLFRWESLSFTLATALTFKDIRDLLTGSYTQGAGGRSSRSSSSRRKPGEQEELFSWFEGFKIDHNFRYGLSTTTASNGFETQTHSIRLTTGNIPLSDKWGMSIGNLSYDLKNRRWVYPSFTLSRDLHCWNMRISWQPQGDTYTFFIGVKAQPFSNYLKFETGRNRFQSF